MTTWVTTLESRLEQPHDVTGMGVGYPYMYALAGRTPVHSTRHRLFCPQLRHGPGLWLRHPARMVSRPRGRGERCDLLLRAEDLHQ